MLGDDHFSPGRTLGIGFPHARRKAFHILAVQFLASCGGAFPALVPRLLVGQAFLLGLFQCLFSDKQSLPFVPPTSTTPPEHDGDQRGMLARAW